jgi:hypothetical protein
LPIQRRAKLATAAGVAAAALTLATGLAVAAGLPDQASDTATQHVADHEVTTTTAPSTTTTVKSDKDDETTATVNTNSEPENDNEGQANRPTDTHGYAVSQRATTTDAQGRAKGEAISTLAKSNAQNDSHEAPETTGTVTAQDHQSAEHGQSADHKPENPGSND